MDDVFAKQMDYVNIIMKYYSWLKLHFLFVITPVSNAMVPEVTLDVYSKIWLVQFWFYIIFIWLTNVLKYKVNIRGISSLPPHPARKRVPARNQPGYDFGAVEASKAPSLELFSRNQPMGTWFFFHNKSAIQISRSNNKSCRTGSKISEWIRLAYM